ncbi:ABC transporter ATP-binding protein [Isoptericola croceus]|uniref:ABC transporter ATP-binding protein n=1 Tax=Isoptericola croceus TaxID=3031406 RepID=UPI0023F708D2|nr:ABC transporter ATP-binding protein [Isoptericola croceus]
MSSSTARSASGPGEVLVAEDLGVSIDHRNGSSTRLVEGLDLVIQSGSSTAVVGRSGSGKTTLLSVLGLMRPPSAGRLYIAGRDVGTLRPSVAAGLRNELLGFVFQNYSLVEHLSVFENVALPLMYGRRATRPQVRERVERQLTAVGLREFGRRRPRSLSGGEQQRVAIARALVRGPRLVLADEPTGALDTATGTSVMKHLQEATVEAGAALIVVTHDDALADSLHRRVDLSSREAAVAL